MITTLVLLVLVVAGIAALVATRPNTFRVERRIDIAAMPKTVFDLVEDFHKWILWSPWEGLDADLKRAYYGPDRGPGAVYEWSGKKAGAGRMEILETKPDAEIRVQLDFTRPIQARNTVEFTFTPEGGGVRVVWTMTGVNSTLSKATSLLLSMDKLVGKDFEKGLAALKRCAEGQA